MAFSCLHDLRAQQCGHKIEHHEYNNRVLEATESGLHRFHPSKENLYVKMDEVTGGRGPDVLFECADTPHTLREAATLVRKGGQVFVISICEEPVKQTS